MTMREQLWRVGAVLLIVFGLVMLLGVSIGLLEGDSEYKVRTDLVLACGLGGIPLGSGIWLWRRVGVVAASRRQAEREKIVLQLAVQHSALTVMEVVAQSPLTLEQAKEALDSLNLKGLNYMDVSDVGVIVYRFPTEVS